MFLLNWIMDYLRPFPSIPEDDLDGWQDDILVLRPLMWWEQIEAQQQDVDEEGCGAVIAAAIYG